MIVFSSNAIAVRGFQVLTHLDGPANPTGCRTFLSYADMRRKKTSPSESTQRALFLPVDTIIPTQCI
ncbi:MAG: hypothetical protein BGP21_10700 [Thiobacillus sp. 65-29]|nr:MAG: hypothetical protein BGP21_10700 [Thiobacillus sp. 65-29]